MIANSSIGNRPWAPADNAIPVSESVNIVDNPLGLIPHQIRGFLSHFSNLLITGQAYDRCTACSQAVIQEYRKRGFDFVRQALENPSYLEEITGLKQLHLETQDVEWDIDEENDESEL